MQLFDNVGRRTRSAGLRGIVTGPARDSRLEQPVLTQHLGRCSRLIGSFVGAGLAFSGSADFAKRSQAIVEGLRRNEAVASVLNGVYLPICLPRLTVDDYGAVLNTVFFKAVERSFETQFLGHQRFENSLAQYLPQGILLAAESRQQTLLERMQRGPVVGIYFPMALLGFSVKAARNQLAELPSNFLLSGGLDVAAALAMYPDVLGHHDDDAESSVPTLVLSGVSFKNNPSSPLTVSTMSGATSLEDLGDISDAFGDFAPGLLVIEDNQ